jgi:lipoprotein-anchoring transpeptidase ErfK/SrfK
MSITEESVSSIGINSKRRARRAPFLTRQGFLKLAGLGLLRGLLPREWFAATGQAQLDTYPVQGRVTEGLVDLYDTPSFKANKVKMHWRDSVLPITTATIGDDEPSYNRIWYQIEGEGFVHSGAIQPVRTILNQPVWGISPVGALAEVTVPYTDARTAPGRNEDVIYRFYYDTVYWVTGVMQDSVGDVWYGVLDDKWKSIYYVLATHMHILPDDDLAPLTPDIPLDQKRIEVHTNEQVVIAYEREQPVFMSRAATGAAFRDGNYFTPAGRHITFCKRPCRHMAAGDLASNGYDLPGVPWICYITENGIAFHGTYWHNDFGKPRSHGCINLPIQAARWIYRWTQPIVPPLEQQVYVAYGTTVDVI